MCINPLPDGFQRGVGGLACGHGFVSASGSIGATRCFAKLSVLVPLHADPFMPS